MVNRNIIIGISILIIIILGFTFFSNMTGSVITGTIIINEKIENEYFKINDSNNQSEEDDLNDTQNISGQK